MINDKSPSVLPQPPPCPPNSSQPRLNIHNSPPARPQPLPCPPNSSQPRLNIHNSPPARPHLLPCPPNSAQPRLIISNPLPVHAPPHPFPCFGCSLGFSSEDQQEQHRLEEHREHYVVGLCLLCGKKCRDKFAYLDHFSQAHHYQFHRLLFHVAQKKGIHPDQITSKIWIVSSLFKPIDEERDLVLMLRAVDLAMADPTDSRFKLDSGPRIQQTPATDPTETAEQEFKPEVDIYVPSPSQILPRAPEQMSPFSIKDEPEEPSTSMQDTQQMDITNGSTVSPLFSLLPEELEQIKKEDIEMMDMLHDHQLQQMSFVTSSTSPKKRTKRKYTTRSGVWAHFGDGPDKKATCVECGREIARPNSGTSAMLTHLKELHPLRYEEAMEHARIKGSLNKGPGRPPGYQNTPKTKIGPCSKMEKSEELAAISETLSRTPPFENIT